VFSKSLIEQKSVKSGSNKTDRASLMRTVRGSEFQTDGAEHRKARLHHPQCTRLTASSLTVSIQLWYATRPALKPTQQI